MSKVICTKEKIDAIADTIRSKLSSSDTYTLDDMPDAIDSISGGGGGNYGTLNVTQNGTYTPTAPYDAYDEVVVNVSGSMPSETLESEWDLLHSNSTNGYLNQVKGVKLGTNRYRNFSNGYLTANGAYVTLERYDAGNVKRVIIEMGAFDRSQEPSQSYLGLLNFMYDSQAIVLYYYNDDDKWLVRDSGGTEWVSGNDLPKYAFENATVEVVYGAKYIDGALYRGRKVNGSITESYKERVTMYIHGQNNFEFEYTFSAYCAEDFMCCIGTGGSAWVGALFKNAKVYNVLDCYDKYYEEPVSLMNSVESEIE